MLINYCNNKALFSIINNKTIRNFVSICVSRIYTCAIIGKLIKDWASKRNLFRPDYRYCEIRLSAKVSLRLWPDLNEGRTGSLRGAGWSR